MKRSVEVDRALWPLVRIAQRRGATAQQYLQLLRSCDDQPPPGGHFAALVYGPAEPDSEGQKCIAEGLRARRTALEHLCLGMAVVIETPRQRSALTAIHWACQPHAPLAPFSSYAGALEWCVELLEARGVALPTALSDHLDRARRASRSTLPPPEPDSPA